MGYFDSAMAEREDYLEHHGILGQKWGVRLFESSSGHLTPAGQARYNTVDGKYQKIGKSGGSSGGVKSLRSKRLQKAANAAQRDANNLRKHGYKEEADAVQKVADKNRAKAEAAGQRSGLSDKQKKAIAAGLAVAGTVAVGALAYKNRDKIAKGASKIKESLNRENLNKMTTNVGTKVGNAAGNAANKISSIPSRAKQGYINGMSKAGTAAGKAVNKAEELGSRAKQGYINGMSKAGTAAGKAVNKAESTANAVKRNYTKPIEKAAALGTRSRLASQQIKSDVSKAVQTGKAAPLVQKRKQYADEARKLASQYTKPGDDSSKLAQQLVNQWLGGSAVIPGAKANINQNNLNYVEDLLKAYGLRKKT